MANTYPTKDQTIKMLTKEPKDAKGNALAMWEQCKEAFSGAKGGKRTVEEFCAKGGAISGVDGVWGTSRPSNSR